MKINKENIKNKILSFPELPGCYLMKNKNLQIIYVGKAKNLKKRVNSYFNKNYYDNKTLRLITEIYDIEYIITDTEIEAILLEANLIKLHKPHYNIMLKDDKSYPFIKIDINSIYPKVIIIRNPVNDGSKYWGPYTNVHFLKKIMYIIKKLFPICDCSLDLNKIYKKPCINYQLKKCSAPCIRNITPENYKEYINSIIDILNGNIDKVKSFMIAKMLKYSEKEEFELAAEMRDNIKFLEIFEKENKIDDPNQVNNKDFIGLHKDGKLVSVSIMQFRNGKILGKMGFILKNAAEMKDEDIIYSFILQYYSTTSFFPKFIMIPFQISEKENLEKFLFEITKTKIKIMNPKRGKNSNLLKLSEKNAIATLVDEKIRIEKYNSRVKASVIELQKQLNLPKMPFIIEGFDISTLQGSETVASMVYFENAQPKKSKYRKFIIKSFEGQNDFAAMEEVITRRYKRLIEENSKFPDLILIDGGKGQLNAAVSSLKKLNLDLPILGLAKKLEEIFLPESNESIILPKSSPALKLLQNVRNEAHRFAITFHRKKREKKYFVSELDQIKGIGEKRKLELLKYFGSLENIKNASLEMLISSKILPINLAKELFNFFHNSEINL